ncbi:MAG: ThuA domain-containing protein [Chitinophagaceae bacterium]|nr:ThuA domain-containing protein [Chitinophagaceae bacterium]
MAVAAFTRHTPRVSNDISGIKVLGFSKTESFRHGSIAIGKEALLKMVAQYHFTADITEDADAFTEENLKKYTVVLFLNTTEDVLNPRQQADFERYIQAGGGYAGVHAATDTEHDWPWYGRLVGGFFIDHPADPNEQEKAHLL